jgi:hypothetical protein
MIGRVACSPHIAVLRAASLCRVVLQVWPLESASDDVYVDVHRGRDGVIGSGACGGGDVCDRGAIRGVAISSVL